MERDLVYEVAAAGREEPGRGRAVFSRIADALAAAGRDRADALAAGHPAPAQVLRLGPGEFREKAAVLVPGLRIEGAGAGLSSLAWDDRATRLLGDGEPMGTFNSYTLYVGAPGVAVRDLTVANDAGDGRKVGQAVAVYADADGLLFERCALLARQDTLCTGPLPKNPVPKGVNLLHPVAGLGADEPVLPFRQTYRSCLIEGDVDFIFGSAMAHFIDCELRSAARDGEACYVAAPSTYPGQQAGFLFDYCRLNGEAPPGTVFLCRPWRATARCAYLDCHLGAHIAAAGWDDWEKPEAHSLGFFGEYASRGPGASMEGRPDWVRRLGKREAAELRALYGKA